MTWRLKRFTPLFTTICRSQEVGQLRDQTDLRGDEEGAIQNVTGDLSNDCRGFFNHLGLRFHCWWVSQGRKQADRPQLQSGGLSEGAGGGTENGAAANIAEALLWQ